MCSNAGERRTVPAGAQIFTDPAEKVAAEKRFSSSEHEAIASPMASKVRLNPALCITNVQRFSLHDGGGIRTVAFVKGCPFRCPWCCNPENLSFEPQTSYKPSLCMACSVRADASRDANGASCDTAPEGCPTGAKERVGQMREVDDLTQELMRDRIFFEESGGGVTISGGECLAGKARQQAVFTLLKRLHDAGISTAVETTLACELALDLAELVRVCDTFLVDFKIANRAESMRVTGIDPAVRDSNLRTLLNDGGNVVARLPIIPGFTDSDFCVEQNATRAVNLGIARADILPFHQLGESKYASLGLFYGMKDVPQLCEHDVARVVQICERAGLKVVVHGE